MSKSNIEQSVRQRLLNSAKSKDVDYNIVLIWYGLERFLYRLSKSEYRDQFILKGAMLFSVWSKQPLRPTKDLDLMAYGEASEEYLRKVITEICRIAVDDDGIVFDPESIEINPIREDQEHDGQRIKLLAMLGNAKIRLQIDIGFGDAITPKASIIEYPSLLGSGPVMLKAYPKETVIAEKLNAMVVLGIANSRMKDFYDLWMMSKQFEFEGDILTKAIAATFERRNTALGDEIPLALTEEFTRDDAISLRWKNFIYKLRGSKDVPPFEQIISELKVFLLTPLEAAKAGTMLNKKWQSNGWV